MPSRFWLTQATTKTLQCPCGGRLADQLDRALGVDGRIGVGHAGHGSEAAVDGRGGARRDRLGILEPRLAEVDVDVDQPRRDDPPRGIDDLRRLPSAAAS